MPYYAPLQVLPWSALTIEGKSSKNIVMESAGVIGFLPIYDNLDTLKKDYPGGEYITFELIQLNAVKALQEEAKNKVFIKLESDRRKRESEADKLAKRLKARNKG